MHHVLGESAPGNIGPLRPSCSVRSQLYPSENPHERLMSDYKHDSLLLMQKHLHSCRWHARLIFREAARFTGNSSMS